MDMRTNDDGVSPVVGVMLMLAVTVMIAAIVSAAAGGLSESEKKAPSAILGVRFFSEKDYGSCAIPSMTIRHVSGNVLSTKDLQLVLYYRTPSGVIIRGNISGQNTVTGDDDWSVFTGGKYCGVLFISDENRFDTDALQDSAKGHASWFGNPSATFGPGDMLVTPARYCESADPHNPSMEYLFPQVNFKEDFKAGGTVSVRILHVPSGQLIYDRDVVIE
ncbi:MAG: type IV pilin [Methanomicrobiales archaeon]|nr:type IV pilin [Methanomicrobiales archaeon]